MKARVTYNDNQEPVRVALSEEQQRKGEWNMEGSTAVYDPHNVPTMSHPGEREIQFVKNMPFVQAMDMGEYNE